MRKIPTTMATQHPDNAFGPYWSRKAFINTSEEIKECYLCFSELGIDEYNWDWEGKFVDEAVADRLMHEYHGYFKKNPLGREKFLTFRIPNPRVEKQFRLARAFMVIVTSSQMSKSLGFESPPIFETILPLTETAREIIELQKAYRDLVSIDHRLLAMEDSLKQIEIIPLFEQVDKIINSADILREYFRLYKENFGCLPEYMRPYCARSDPALNSGFVPTILALKIALSTYIGLEKETGVKLYPMLGTGTLPFRGGLSPLNLETALSEYAGISTLTVQSAFRYDFPKAVVKKAIKKIHFRLPHASAMHLPGKLIEKIKGIIPAFEDPYRETVEKIAPLVNFMSTSVAKRRERMLHVGLFGYSRGVGKVSLPRAIPFTASLYSLGIPPEFIGTGRGLAKAKKKGLLSAVNQLFIHMKENLVSAGYFLNRENLSKLAKRYNYWQDVIEDIRYTEEILQIELGPKNLNHREHLRITGLIYERIQKKKEIIRLITIGGQLRKSLG